MALIATINTASIRDHGFLTETRFNQLERMCEDAAGNGQFVALIEGITHDEASADDSPWSTNPEKPGRAIEVNAETYEDLAEAVAWVSENYDVFSTHVETDDIHAPLSDGDLDEVQRSMDEAGAPEDACAMCSHPESQHSHGPNADECDCGCSYFRQPSIVPPALQAEQARHPDAQPQEGCTRCSCGAKYWDKVETRGLTIWICASCRQPWDGLDHTNDAPPRSSYDVEVAAQVRAAVGTAQDAAVNRFPNDAGAALRYLSALLAVAAEEV